MSLGEMGNEQNCFSVARYSHASSTWFNGFASAKVVHINQ
jgi:hypothetical protein